MTPNDRDIEQRIGRIESMVERIESIPDAALRSSMQDLLAAVLEYHGAGLSRILDAIDDAKIIQRLTEDPLVASLFVLYDIHPRDTHQRVMEALDRVRPYLESHGGNVELVLIDGECVTLRMEGSCDGCPSSAITVKNAIEKAVLEAAPEISKLIVDGVPGATAEPKVLVQLEAISTP